MSEDPDYVGIKKFVTNSICKRLFIFTILLEKSSQNGICFKI